tara:strand:+ start:7896 stop:8114 length:219 start_codon:yes stop_codon:yes gene_type:complete
MLSQLLLKKNDLINERVKLERKLKCVSTEINKIQCGINKLCKHEWVRDYIDKPYGNGSDTIYYCLYCETIKN